MVISPATEKHLTIEMQRSTYVPIGLRDKFWKSRSKSIKNVKVFEKDEQETAMTCPKNYD